MSTIQQSESESTSRRTRILHLEDNEFDLELVRSLLEKEDLNCEITPVETQADFVRALESGEWDLILSDYALPSFNGLEALAIAVATCPNTPFIFVTGTLGEDIAVESLKVGATDYVLKQRMARLSSSVRRALKERAERLRRELAERELGGARSSFVTSPITTLLPDCPIGHFSRIAWSRPLPARGGTQVRSLYCLSIWIISRMSTTRSGIPPETWFCSRLPNA